MLGSIVMSDSSTFQKSPTITDASAVEGLLSHQEDVIRAEKKKEAISFTSGPNSGP